ncbi:WD repeat, SAM and U-box domain-containing protein 1-like [Scleropages formosus]|uniref:WD repeat, SAM and U-box domain-containing protein 1 n=1 Tax=Scleropages formosus TaxID=113540 RepID=A0A0P7VTS3_SCLFO|nr:WD repeat, SAM and U-box domain-containing protein 1-like [Scleropages formosus]
MVSLICTLQDHRDDVNWCAFSASLLATCSTDKTVRVYSVRDFSELPFSPLTGHGYGVHCCCFSACGRYLASCSTDATTVVWHTDSGDIAAAFEHPGRSPVRVCAFSPDSAHLVSGGSDGTLALWDLRTKTLRRTCVVNEATVVACSFSPCGQAFVTGSSYGDLRLWDPEMNQQQAVKNAHDLGVTCCHFAPQMQSADGDSVLFRLSSCGQDSLLKIWIISHHAEAGNEGKSLPGRRLAGHRSLLMGDWSEDDVSAWLHEEGLEALVDTFKANNIDGAELLSLSKEMLAMELNIESAGLRNKVIRKVTELKMELIGTGVPDEFLCPITREIMKDPVLAADGYSYEREAIEDWIKAKNRSSPMTNLPLPTTTVTPNRTLKMAISRWKASQ